jgi:hypothetical protein
MRKSVVALSLAMLTMVTPRVWADGTGLTVNGVLTLFTAGDIPLQPTVGGENFLNSINGYVPPGYGNSTPGATAVIGSGVEFGLNDGADLLTIDFTGTTVTFTDTCIGPFCGFTPVTLSVYSPYITGYSIISNTIPDISVGYGDNGYFPGPAASLTFFGDTSSSFTGGSLVASYTSITPPTPALALAANDPSDPPDPPDPPAVPEPASFGLMAMGLVGMAGMVRKRFA